MGERRRVRTALGTAAFFLMLILWSGRSTSDPPPQQTAGAFEMDHLGIKLTSMDLDVVYDPKSDMHLDKFQRNCSRPLYDYDGYKYLAQYPGYNAKAFLVYNSRLALLKVSKSASTTVYGYLTQYGQRISDPFRLEYVDLGQDLGEFTRRFANHTFLTTLREPCQRVASAYSTLVHRDKTTKANNFDETVSKFVSGRIKHYHHLLPQTWFYYGFHRPMYIFEVNSGLTGQINRFLNQFFDTHIVLKPVVKNPDEGRQKGNKFCDYLKSENLYCNFYGDELLYAEFRKFKVDARSL